MSDEVVIYSWMLSLRCGSEREVYAYLYGMGGGAVSVATIAKAVGISTRHAQRALRALCEQGALQCEPFAGGKTKYTPIWGGDKMSGVTKCQGCQNVRGDILSGVTFCQGCKNENDTKSRTCEPQNAQKNEKTTKNKYKYNNNNNNNNIYNNNFNNRDNIQEGVIGGEEKKEEPPKKVAAKFKKPTIEEIATYCAARGNAVNAEAFFYYYESKGWVIGKAPMKNWQAAVRTWEQKDKMNKKSNNYENRTNNTRNNASNGGGDIRGTVYRFDD